LTLKNLSNRLEYRHRGRLMYKIIEGQLDAKGFRFALLISRFNEFISAHLLDGCMDCLTRHGAREESIKIFKVPGAFEIPSVAKKLADSKSYDAVICLGAVIRGDTPHFEYVAAEVSKGIARISQDSGLPVIYGIVTADNLEQAIERAGTKAGNRGWDAALSAIEMVNLFKSI
jgi:6,7-dimethyl-8-ribityllumazine synthase